MRSAADLNCRSRIAGQPLGSTFRLSQRHAPPQAAKSAQGTTSPKNPFSVALGSVCADSCGRLQRPMRSQFVSAAIQPVLGTIDPRRMSLGEPGLPQQFLWGSQTLRIVSVLRTWRETGPCHHGSGERYARKHWFEVVTDSGDTMKIYFERQARSRQIRGRWRLFTIDKKQPTEGT